MIAQGRPLPCGLTAVEDCAAAFFAQGKGKAVNPQSARRPDDCPGPALALLALALRIGGR